MENLNKAKNIFREFRSAHRIINECQTFIFNLIFKVIMPKFELAPCTLECKRLFCSPLRAKDSVAFNSKTFGISKDNWAWDLIYTHVLEYYLGSRKVEKKVWHYAVIQVSDTGSYQSDIRPNEKSNSTRFDDENQCDSILIFKVKEDVKTMHTNEETIVSIVRSEKEKYISQSSGAAYYKVSLSEFVDRERTEQILDKILKFFKEIQS